MDTIAVYFETGKTRTFAGAMDWPGWCRSARDEAGALRALFDYGPRYASAIQTSKSSFVAPEGVEAFAVVERLVGDATTDYGTPGKAPASDAQAVSFDELRRFIKLLRACWKTLDNAAAAAAGHELRKGPRGGGRDLDKIMEHVLMAEAAYVGRIGDNLDPSLPLVECRKALLRALEHSVEGKVPAVGPRGGQRWSPRYFVRRAAWHVLDHAWEIEDRLS